DIPTNGTQVGYGYTVTSGNTDPTGKSLTANLKLIDSSDVYGPDIPLLTLTAR
ncbi:alpha-glucosidase, partial [Trifolium medium]|nr:alpha-glucosidase [Trifolium medium]